MTKEYYEAHKEEIKAKQLAYRTKNRARINAQTQQWREEHREEVKQKQRVKWAGRTEEQKKKHRDRCRAYQRQRYLKDPEAGRERQRDWARKNPEKAKAANARGNANKVYDPEYHRDRHLKYYYGITAAEYDRLLEEQHGLCAICATAPEKRRLNVDHDHKTGNVRGLLCIRCNRALGLMRDEPLHLAAAIRYLARR